LDQLYPSPAWNNIELTLPDGEKMAASKVISHLKSQADRNVAIEFKNNETRMDISAQRRKIDRLEAEIELLQNAVAIIRADHRRQIRRQAAQTAGQPGRSNRQLHLDGVVSLRLLHSHNREVVGNGVHAELNEELDRLYRIGQEMEFRHAKLIERAGVDNLPMALGAAQRILYRAELISVDGEQQGFGATSGTIHDGLIADSAWPPELTGWDDETVQRSEWDSTTAQ